MGVRPTQTSPWVAICQVITTSVGSPLVMSKPLYEFIRRTQAYSSSARCFQELFWAYFI